MASDQGPVVQSALLRSELTRLRKEKNLTQEQVARALEWSPSKLIRIEGGRNSITKTDLDALLRQYGVTSEGRLEHLQSLARGARERAWWNEYRGEIFETYLDFVGYEAGASFIRHFHGSVIPGLLQTPEYAEVLTAGSVAPVRVAPVVKLRLQRQRALAERADPPRQYHVVDEAVIRRHVGIKTDPGIMPAQLRYIIETVERNEQITVRVIPFRAGAHSGLFGAYTHLEFDGGLGDVLFLESGRVASTMVAGDDPQVNEYRDAFEILTEEALTAEESLKLIREVAEEL
jgi:transcriptional regulator with XRE-family HTH domain